MNARPFVRVTDVADGVCALRRDGGVWVLPSFYILLDDVTGEVNSPDVWLYSMLHRTLRMRSLGFSLLMSSVSLVHILLALGWLFNGHYRNQGLEDPRMETPIHH